MMLHRRTVVGLMFLGCAAFHAATLSAEPRQLLLTTEYGSGEQALLHAPIDLAQLEDMIFVLSAGDCSLRPVGAAEPVGPTLSSGCGEAPGQFENPSALYVDAGKLWVLAGGRAHAFSPSAGYEGSWPVTGELPTDLLVQEGLILGRSVDRPHRLLHYDPTRQRSRLLWEAPPGAWLWPVRAEADTIWAVDSQHGLLHRFHGDGRSVQTWPLGSSRGKLERKGGLTSSQPAMGAAVWLRRQGLLVALTEDFHPDQPPRLRLYPGGSGDFEWVGMGEGIGGGRLVETAPGRIWVLDRHGSRVQQLALRWRSKGD